MDATKISVLTTDEDILKILNSKEVKLNEFKDFAEDDLIIIGNCDNQELINEAKNTRAFKIFVTEDKEKNMNNVDVQILVLQGTLQESIYSLIDSLTSVINLKLEDLKNIQGKNFNLITSKFSYHTLEENILKLSNDLSNYVGDTIMVNVYSGESMLLDDLENCIDVIRKNQSKEINIVFSISLNKEFQNQEVKISIIKNLK